MRAARVVLGLLGVGVAAVGVGFLLDDDSDDQVNVATWLLGGVVIHDGLLAMLVVVIGVVGARALPRWARAPVAVGFIVLGTVTVTAIPALGRFGARPDNPTLLDRDYTAGWLVLVALTAVGVAAGCVWQRRGERAGGQVGGPAGIPAGRPAGETPPDSSVAGA